ERFRPNDHLTFFPHKPQSTAKDGIAGRSRRLSGMEEKQPAQGKGHQPIMEKRSRDFSTLATNALVSREESFSRRVSRTCSGVMALMASKAASRDLPNVRSMPPVPIL